MKTLLILRHAKSSWKDEALPDIERPLNKRGKRQAPEMGLLLREENLTPDWILSSPAVRARLTAEAVAQESGYEEQIEIVPRFYPGEVEDYVAALRRVPEPIQSVMVVGHNPTLDQLLALLTGESESLSTAALAFVSLPVDHWKALNAQTRGELVNLWRPRETD